MTAFYITLKISALLAVIILPLFGPKRKKLPTPDGLSHLAVNENGCLEIFSASAEKHHSVL